MGISGNMLREIKSVVKAVAKSQTFSIENKRRAAILDRRIEKLGDGLDLSFGGRLDGGKTQEEAIMEYLKAGNELTKLESLKLFGCLSLNGVICNLRRKGHTEIQTKMRTVGKRSNISVYYIDCYANA